MELDCRVLEKDAHLLLSEEKFEEAYRLFKKAADIYSQLGSHKESALCFASAASCWAIKSGEKNFYNSAISYEEAGRQAEKAGDLEYASMLYKYAAVSYERDLEFLNFSECFFRSKECYRRFLTLRLIKPGKVVHIAVSAEEKGLRGVCKRVFSWLTLTFSSLIWGHGERPGRTLFCGLILVFSSAYLYAFGHLVKKGMAFKPDFFDAFYFSVVTFTTVGFGDITPIGLSKLVAMFEALCGLFISSIFIIGLSRKYLRV